MRPPHTAVFALVLAAIAAASCSSPSPSTSASTRRAAPRDAGVTSQDLENSHEPVEQVLQRKVPGLVVSRANDGSIALTVRGSRSWNDEARAPLYILNGAPFAVGPDGALSGVNPYDIESIKLLRGAEAALYGIDGAHGVIVITTKKAGPRGR